MKKIHSFLMAAVLVAGSLTSCSSSDDMESKTAQSQQEIKFSANAELTRGTVFTGTDGPSDMKVYAFKGTESATNYINGATFTKAGETYSCTTKYYWPTGSENADKLTFLALHPTNANLTIDGAPTAPSFSYTASTTIGDQVDLMAAKSEPLLLSGTTAGKVALTFNHLLTQIVFKGYVEENANLKVNVKGIEICNVKNTGSTTTGTALAAGDTKANYAITPSPTELGQGSANATELTTTASNIMMLIPQQLTAWDRANTTITANNSGDQNTYLKVSVTVQNKTNNDFILGTDAETPQNIYFPLNTNWVAGKKVIYTLQFGATTGAGNGVGYKDDGTPETLNATGVTFSASVTDWVDDAQTVTF